MKGFKCGTCTKCQVDHEFSTFSFFLRITFSAKKPYF